MARASSPEPGRSTLMTWAPRSARIMLAAGPATIVLRSRTRTPERTAGISLCSHAFARHNAIYCLAGVTGMKLYILFIAAIAAHAADDPFAAALFKKHCASCHESANAAAARIPPVATLKAMTPGAILKTLESGV